MIGSWGRAGGVHPSVGFPRGKDTDLLGNGRRRDGKKARQSANSAVHSGRMSQGNGGRRCLFGAAGGDGTTRDRVGRRLFCRQADGGTTERPAPRHESWCPFREIGGERPINRWRAPRGNGTRATIGRGLRPGCALASGPYRSRRHGRSGAALACGAFGSSLNTGTATSWGPPSS